MSENVAQKKLFTQIQSGKFKGAKILLPSMNSTRSTKNIVKGCVFDVLRSNLINKIFIEVFGGSASMALEALSNNALKAYAIELDKKAYEIALKNAENYDDLEIIFGDSFEILPKLLEKLSKENCKIILYFDPPFDIRAGFKNIYESLKNLILKANLTKVENIIFEHNSSFIMPESLINFNLKKFKKFGNTSLSFYEVKI